MAFKISCGKCSCENEVVNKEDFITWESQNETAQMVNTDILNPILKLLDSKIDCNYVYIRDFGGRFYFVENAESIAGGHCLLHCHVDVLYSYKDSIKNLECLVSRNEFKENPFLVDTLLPIEKKFDVYSKNVGSGPILTASGIYSYFLVKIAN